jgi:serine/threonine-protein kinase 24/25/MST4
VDLVVRAENILVNSKGDIKLSEVNGLSPMVLTHDHSSSLGLPFWYAPEVIRGCGSNAKSWVWSLGITAIELAEGLPPHFHVHPIRCLFLIPKHPAPTLAPRPAGRAPWTKCFHDFVSTCLEKNSTNRLSPAELLSHPFIANAPKVEVMRPVLQVSRERERE